MKKVFILSLLILMGQSSWAQIRPFQTTRLLSTAGTGVASILSTEATLLNPAASGFFTGPSFSYQSYKTSIQNKNNLREENFPSKNNSNGVFISDNSGSVKGGIAYLTQDENYFKRERTVLNASAPIGTKTAMGFNYSYILDKRPSAYRHRHGTYHQVSAGLTHIIDEDTIIGLVIVDPSRSTPKEDRLLAGFQYTVADRFNIMGDAGVRYSKNFSQNYLWSAAVQMNLFSDFFLRVGQFYDNVQKFKGTGWGVGWMGPRFGVEFGQKFSEQFRSDYYVYSSETLVDSALSALIKF